MDGLVLDSAALRSRQAHSDVAAINDDATSGATRALVGADGVVLVGSKLASRITV